ncbi:hypothetical protein JKF63_05817 [Porcisia hertigi]|uniref:DAGKc domain-containing protein n=1 Tax=Porcisia hertigi TaxID=2761500 RepID=A0A836IUW2_9TRYP|nr:hypothetical protein JKF63_05817 [Porcisia hertigi]
MTNAAVMRQTSPAMSSPRCCLQVWVVGNPTSGGKRGAVVLDRIQTLFCKSFGIFSVRTTSSSSFLSSLSPHKPVLESPTPSTEGEGTHRCSPAVAPNSANASVNWNAAAVTPPVHPAGRLLSSEEYTLGGVALQMLMIRTDQSGHAKAVSHALSQLILSSRLDDDERHAQVQGLSTAQNGINATVVVEQDNHLRASPLQPTSSTSATHSGPSSSSPQSLTHHILLVVGGDGTLSEVTNGLCEGALSVFEQLTLSSDGGCADTAANTSHAYVEREATVLSHLLPAILYVPGGTGSDFARMGLCCRTPEEALRVVRDGLIPQLFPAASSGSDGGGGDGSRAHRGKKGWRSMFSKSPAAQRSQPSQPASEVCVAHAVDIGRIEFLRTGTRHFFINECSVGMSTDVIQRVERFKHSWWISKLGGVLLFAIASFISLLHMTPKPLYICKLPSRVPLVAASTARIENDKADGGTTEEDTNRHQRNQKCNGNYDDGAVAMCRSGTGRKPISAGPCPDTVPESLSAWPHSLVSLAPFARLSGQLDRLFAQLRWSARMTASTSTSGHPSGDLAHTTASCFTQRAGTRTLCRNSAASYNMHARTHAHDVLRLLDITPSELEMQRMQQAQRRNSVAAATSTKAVGKKDIIHHGPAAVTHTGTGEERLGNTRHEVITQMGDSDSLNYSHSPINSGDCYGDSMARRSADGANVKAHSCMGDDAWSHSARDDDLSLVTWVETLSSMFAFANGRWYGGGMLVAPHASPTDGLISCTNWVAKMLPFVLGAPFLYTGRHVRWRSTSAFDGERFLITNVSPFSSVGATKASLVSSADASLDAGEPLYIEADGQVLEAAPAIVELSGKLTFLVPSAASLRLGSPAPGTTRASCATPQP